MKPATLGIFSFFTSLIAFQLLGILTYAAVASMSSSGVSANSASTILPLIVILAIVGALLTGLKVYALERS